jgi:hypothetical protein
LSVSLPDKSALLKMELLAGLICQKADGKIDEKKYEEIVREVVEELMSV